MKKRLENNYRIQIYVHGPVSLLISVSRCATKRSWSVIARCRTFSADCTLYRGWIVPAAPGTARLGLRGCKYRPTTPVSLSLTWRHTVTNVTTLTTRQRVRLSGSLTYRVVHLPSSFNSSGFTTNMVDSTLITYRITWLAILWFCQPFRSLGAFASGWCGSRRVLHPKRNPYEKNGTRSFS